METLKDFRHFVEKLHESIASMIPTALKNPYTITIQFNGRNAKTYDGSSAQTLNITPSAIGITAASSTNDGLMSKEDKALIDRKKQFWSNATWGDLLGNFETWGDLT